MKKIFIAIAATAALSAALTGCGKAGKGNLSTNDSLGIDSIVKSVDIDLKILTASRSYDVDIDTSSYHLVMTASVQWPVKDGDFKLSALQDTIKAICFPPKAGDITHAIAQYVSDLSQTGLDSHEARITPTDRVYPDSVNSFNMSLNCRVMEFGQRLLTYQMVQNSYLGGAHPNTVSRTITFDLDRNRIISVDDLIDKNRLDDFYLAILKQLGEQFDLSATELRETLLVPSITGLGTVYLADGYIYMHYNPYDILPYSFGTIDVQLSPWQYDQLLTPYARELLVS